MTTLLSQPVLVLGAVPVEYWVYGGVAALVVAAAVLGAATYRRCPAGKLLVVYGSVGGDRAFKVLHGGGTWVVPLVQDFGYVSLEPMVFDFPRLSAETGAGERVWLSLETTVAVSLQRGFPERSAEAFLNLPVDEVRTRVGPLIVSGIEAGVRRVGYEQFKLGVQSVAGAIGEGVDAALGPVGMAAISFNLRSFDREPT